jgi:hypothetical protein
MHGCKTVCVADVKHLQTQRAKQEGRHAGRCSACAAGACCGGRHQGVHPGVAAGRTVGRCLPALPGHACGCPGLPSAVSPPLTASPTDAGRPHLRSPILQAYAAADAFLAALQPRILADEVPSPAPEVVQVRSQHLRALPRSSVTCTPHQNSLWVSAQLQQVLCVCIHMLQL